MYEQKRVSIVGRVVWFIVSVLVLVALVWLVLWLLFWRNGSTDDVIDRTKETGSSVTQKVADGTESITGNENTESSSAATTPAETSGTSSTSTTVPSSTNTTSSANTATVSTAEQTGVTELAKTGPSDVIAQATVAGAAATALYYIRLRRKVTA